MAAPLPKAAASLHGPPYLLALESSTHICSVALFAQQELLALQETYQAGQHSRILTVLIEQILKNVGIQPSALGAVAIAAGPGSYTGLRIGTSAAKGLCMALGIPLIAVPTLQALAGRLAPEAAKAGATLRPLLDARRDEVYTARYSPALEELSPAEAVILTVDAFADELAAGPVFFLGDGAPKASQLLSPHPNAHFFPAVGCSAASKGTLAWAKFSAGDFEPTLPFEPFYLKSYNVGPPKGSN